MDKNLLPEKEKQKKKKRVKTILILLLICCLCYQQVQLSICNSKNTELTLSYQNKTGEFKDKEDNELFVALYKGVIKFFDMLYALPERFVIKALVFLGFIFLLQISVNVISDVVELFVLGIVIVKRLVVFIYKKVRGKQVVSLPR